jgi:cytochrome bd ubiquinol oxidase subunit II
VSLQEVPMVFILAGLVFYIVLGGADFGAAIWQVTGGPGDEGRRIRDLAHTSMSPVWEANHVWLIFVLTVTWTCYPAAFGSIASTLCVALFLAGLGLIVRGAAYALRSGSDSLEEVEKIDMASAVSSVLTPFFLGAAIGGIASGRVPYGNARGDLIDSWLNPTGVAVGALAIVFSAYMSAVFLCGDAVRRGAPELVPALRTRALLSGLLAGVLALVGLVVLHHDAHRVYHELVAGDGLPALIVSVLAGGVTIALVQTGRFEPARLSAAVAVAAIVAGWAMAQSPVLLPGLTIKQAAAPHDTLVTAIVAIVAGAVILFPSLVLLFRLSLRGRLGYAHPEEHPELPPPPEAVAPGPRAIVAASAPGLLARAAAAALAVGVGMLTIAEAGWAHAIGVVALLAVVPLGTAAAVPGLLTDAAQADGTSAVP